MLVDRVTCPFKPETHLRPGLSTFVPGKVGDIFRIMNSGRRAVRISIMLSKRLP